MAQLGIVRRLSGVHIMKDQIISDTKRSLLAVWSLVLGILGILLGVYLGFVAGIAAVICGHKALSRLKKDAGRLTGRGLAIAGLVLGYLEIAWLVVWIMIVFIGFSHR